MSPRYLTFNSKGNEGIGDNDNDHDNEADRDVDDGDGDDNGDLSINTHRGRLLFRFTGRTRRRVEELSSSRLFHSDELHARLIHG